MFFNAETTLIHGKNDFAEISKNLDREKSRYRSENNSVGPSK